MTGFPEEFGSPECNDDDLTLDRISIDDVKEHPPVMNLSGYYNPQEDRIRDTVNPSGYPVITFANILKYHSIPLPEILTEILEMGRKGMGTPVEIEFSVNMPFEKDKKPEFCLLQVRPMAIEQQDLDEEISEEDIKVSLCYSTMALGNGKTNDITEIVYVRPEKFDPAKTVEIGIEIGKINSQLLGQEKKYLLIGPGRWGSADRWLGIPVSWKDISGVGAVIESTCENLNADPSQGSHFFHNITSLGISYLNTSKKGADFIKWDWLESLPAVNETEYLKHITLEKPLLLKIDGKNSHAVVLMP